ncbi:Cytochrome P450 [Macleaya cordata]|uniref:Cytochrome P450 n=1 Tax=Macleaya cordata TaxID=56857 RepID=A0A200R2U0_MACCD|nr:Cytochrome P450 [Macleaya cordata]
MSRAWETLDHYIAQSISSKQEQLSKRSKTKEEDEEKDGIDLLTSYMEEDSIIGSKSDKFLRDTVLNFMVAGKDTVSAALTWFFWLVSMNPVVETKIIEELKANLSAVNEATKWRTFDSKELNSLVYLHGAFCESLQLCPPVPFQTKRPIREDVLPSGHKVDPCKEIFLLSYSMGRMEAVWGKDCLEFKPERWISEQGRIKYEPSYKFMAFNAGPRTCLGKEVAFVQMKSIAATLIYNYHVEVVKGHPVRPKLSIIFHMKHGLMARVRRRMVHE